MHCLPTREAWMHVWAISRGWKKKNRSNGAWEEDQGRCSDWGEKILSGEENRKGASRGDGKRGTLSGGETFLQIAVFQDLGLDSLGQAEDISDVAKLCFRIFPQPLRRPIV